MSEQRGFIAKYAKVFVGVAVLCGAMSGSLGALISAPSMAIGFWRLTLALPFFLIPVFAKKDMRESLFSISRKNLIWCFLSGLFLFGHFAAWFTAVKTTNVSSAAVLASLHPLVVLLITVFIYRKKVSWKSVAAIVLALIGGAVIMGADLSTFSGGCLEGNLWAFLGGMFMGIYFAIGGNVRKEVHGSVYVSLVFFSCWMFFAIGVLATGTPIVGYPTMDFVRIIAMTLICQIGSHAVWNLCLGNVSSLYVSTWEAGDPVFSTLIAVVLVKQIPSSFEIVGCAIVVTALLLYNKFERESDV